MAGGWGKQDSVQEQIDASLSDEVQRARANLPTGESLAFCEECEAEIPTGRRKALPGVRLCVKCQSMIDAENQAKASYNRRGSKDSQLR